MTDILRLRDTDLEWREVEGEVVALDLESSNYLAVNQSGATLWAALADGATREELIGALVATYGISRKQAASDTDRFVGMLVEQNMLLES